jgi:hypothetical protein
VTSHKTVAWVMLAFAVLGWPAMKLAHLGDTLIVIVYSVVALVYPSVLAIWMSDE